MKQRSGFQPGTSGNPGGRPPGQTLAGRLRLAVGRDFDQIVDALIFAAKGGDTTAASLLLSRTVAQVKAQGEPVAVTATDGSLTGKATAIVDAALSGAVPPDVAKQLLEGLAALARVQETDELARRIEELEKRL